ncbi:MAG: CPBP family intramembrane metalloprotease, partial [Acidimicrobiaceae bacterium]|nr:CPBP family intramembrane metalloprotease [Acidimicrobiaceae bacterium]
EVFFRGLLQGALQDRLGPVWAVSIASVAFGITHFQVVQLPALVLVGVVNGLLVLRTGRLGPALWSHAAFNAVTVAVLVS